MASGTPWFAYVLAGGIAVILLGFVGLVLFGNLVQAQRRAALAWRVITPDGGAVGGAFDDARPFSGGVAPVARGGRWGLVDARGVIVLEPTFEALESPSEGVMAARREGAWGLVDVEGREVLPFAYDRIDPMTDGIAVIVEQVGVSTSRISSAQPLRSSGLADRTGRVLVAPKPKGDPDLWLSARGPSEGRVAVERADGWALCDLSGRPVGAARYDEVRAPSGGRAAVRRGEAWGYVDLDGVEVIPLQFRWAGDFSEGKAAVGLADGAGAVVDPAGGVVWRGLLDGRAYRDGRAPVLLPAGWTIVDETGRPLAPPRWSDLGELRQGFAVARDGDARFLVDREGTVVYGPAADLLPVGGGGVTLARLPRDGD